MASGRIRKMLVDATNLEVNSILVSSISGRKLPEITHAFYEIVSAWVFQLIDLKNRLKLDRVEIDEEIAMSRAAENWEENSKSLFEKYHVAGARFTEFADERLVVDVLNTTAMREAYDAIVLRIQGHRNADDYNAELLRLLKVQRRLSMLRGNLKTSLQGRDDDSEMQDLRDMQELRKMWELKDGYIYAQNTVQLDGDIINRINLRLYRDRNVKDMAMQMLEFHRKNVDVGIQHWHFIIETIASLAKAVGERIVNPFR